MTAPLRRKIIAFAVVAFLPGMAFGLLGFLSGNPATGAWAFTLAATISLIAAVVGVLPILIVLHVCRAKKLIYYILGGVVLGLLVASVLLGPGILSAKTLAGWPSFVAQISIIVVIAVVSAFIYWMIARPDRE